MSEVKLFDFDELTFFVIVRGNLIFNEKWCHSMSERNGMSVTRGEPRLESSTGGNDREQESDA